MSASSISNSDDVIDSRDVIERIEELQAKAEALNNARRAYINSTGEEASEAARIHAVACSDDYTEEEREELEHLIALQEEAGGSPDWKYGEQLIRDSYFKEWCQEFAEEIGAIKPDATWPYTCIDWDYAAREMKDDYTQVEFDGVTYWIRS